MVKGPGPITAENPKQASDNSLISKHFIAKDVPPFSWRRTGLYQISNRQHMWNLSVITSKNVKAQMYRLRNGVAVVPNTRLPIAFAEKSWFYFKFLGCRTLIFVLTKTQPAKRQFWHRKLHRQRRILLKHAAPTKIHGIPNYWSSHTRRGSYDN